MSTKFFQKFDQFIFPTAILFFSLVITFTWFRKGLMFAGGEEGIPFYNLTRHLDSIYYVWFDSYAGYSRAILLPRIPYFWVLEALFRLGIAPVALQALTFFILIFTGCVSIYFLIKETVGKKFLSFLSSVFYLLNPFSMVQIWGRGIYAQFFAFALVPLFLLFFILGVRTKNLIYFVLAVIASLFFSAAFVFPTQILVLWIPVFIYSVFHIWVNKDRKDEVISTLGFLVFLGASWLLTQSWWIWPYFKTMAENVSRLGDLDYNLGSLRGISRESSLTVVSRLIHKFLLVGTYGNIYLGFPFKLLSWLIPLISVFSLRLFRKLKSFGFYVILFLVSLFIVQGSNLPLGWLFVWLFERVSVFQGFRNPYEKAGILLMISYTPFFAIGVLEVSNRLCKFLKIKSQNIFVLIIMFLICGLYVWPMWTGQFAGGVKMNPWIKVPAYYKEADNWIKDNNGNARIIQMPLNPGDGVLTKWDYPYRGIEPNSIFFSNPTIGGNTGLHKLYYNVLLERFSVFQKNAFGPDPDITKSEFRSKNLYEELGKLNIRYIVLHHDIDESLSGMETFQETADYLVKEKNIQKVKTFGLLDIYEVKLPGEMDHIYSPDSKVSYEKYSPVFYTFKVEDSKKSIMLNFLEAYDQGWELFVGDEKIEAHSRVFSYANSWTIDKIGTYTGYIKYKPQDYVKTGWKITKIALILSGGVLAYTIFKRRR